MAKRNLPKIRVSKRVYLVVVDYRQSLADMIKAGNNKKTISDEPSHHHDITAEHFPLSGTGQVKLDMFIFYQAFNHEPSSDEVLQEMDKHSFRPATLPELLALRNVYRGRGWKTIDQPIVALGSAWTDSHGTKLVPVMWPLDDGHVVPSIALFNLNDVWSDGCLFAAVRK